MKITLKLFAVAKQLAGRDALELELPDEATVAHLRAQVRAEVPEFADLVDHMLFAVNMQYADDGTKIPPSADIACIPPVSGG